MTTHRNYPKEFFVKLAYLMYDVVITDRKIAIKEKIKIRDIVEEHQLPPTIEKDDREIIYKLSGNLY